MPSIENQDWDTVIESKQQGLEFGIKEIWHYRDLLWLFVLRDFVSFYKQTILGPFWFFIQPLFTTAIYIFLFRNLANLSTDGIPGPLFYIVGITIWSYFSETLSKVSNVLRDNASIFGKVYFPRMIMPLSIVFSSLFKLGVQLILLALIMLYFILFEEGVSINYKLVYFPFLILVVAFQSLGFGMIVAAFTSKYRDFAMLLGFGLQLLMYATPVIYPLSSITGIWKIILSLNPMTTVVECMRLCLFGKGTVTASGISYMIFVTLIVFFIGFIVFRRTEKNFVDTI
ncbi:MAG: ABC transporter permease [Chitinophagia bacterium]|jgi:lipopolysaccharide transport system permease protein